MKHKKHKHWLMTAEYFNFFLALVAYTFTYSPIHSQSHLLFISYSSLTLPLTNLLTYSPLH